MKKISKLIKSRQPELIEKGAQSLIAQRSQRHTDTGPDTGRDTDAHPQTGELDRETYTALFSSLYRALLQNLKSSPPSREGPDPLENFLRAIYRIPALRENPAESFLILTAARRDVNRVVLESRDLELEIRLERMSRINALYDKWIVRLADFWIERMKKTQQLAEDLRIVKNDLQRQLNVLYQTINRSPLGVADCDQEMRIIRWNALAARLTGYTPPEILGRNVAEMMYGQSRELFIKKVKSKSELISNLKLNIRRKDGDFFPAILSISKTRPPHHGNIFLIIRFAEMSNVGKESSLNQRIQKLTTLSRLTSAMMHDIRNPLNNIGLHADLLAQTLSREYGELGAETNKIIDTIQRQIFTLNQSLKHYLSYTQLTEMNVEPTILNARLEEFLQDISYPAVQQKVAIHYKLPRKSYSILADWNQLKRAFANITENAIEAMDEGEIRIRLEKRGNRILVRIRDNGPGIEPGVREHIFQPFYTTKGKNNGLGLFIAREIVAAHNGRLSFTTAPDRYTEFTISLPLDDKPEIEHD